MKVLNIESKYLRTDNANILVDVRVGGECPIPADGMTRYADNFLASNFGVGGWMFYSFERSDDELELRFDKPRGYKTPARGAFEAEIPVILEALYPAYFAAEARHRSALAAAHTSYLSSLAARLAQDGYRHIESELRSAVMADPDVKAALALLLEQMEATAKRIFAGQPIDEVADASIPEVNPGWLHFEYRNALNNGCTTAEVEAARSAAREALAERLTADGCPVRAYCVGLL